MTRELFPSPPTHIPEWFCQCLSPGMERNLQSEKQQPPDMFIFKNFLSAKGGGKRLESQHSGGCKFQTGYMLKPSLKNKNQTKPQQQQNLSSFQKYFLPPQGKEWARVTTGIPSALGDTRLAGNTPTGCYSFRNPAQTFPNHPSKF